MVRVKTKGHVRVPPEGKVVAYRYEIYRPPKDRVEEPDRVEMLPDIPILKIHKREYPTHDKEPMMELLLWPLFVCYNLYYHDERQLDLLDIHAIMCMVFHGQGHRMEPRLYEKLDRDNDMTKELDAKADNEDYTVPWKERIGRWYKELQDNDPEVKAKAEELSGFIGRPGYDNLITKHNQRPTNNRHFRLDQHAFIYGVHQWCRDNNGKTLEAKTRLWIILHHYNLAKAKLTQEDITLLSGGKLFQDGAFMNAPAYAEKHRKFFEHKVMEAQRRYESYIGGRPDTVEAVTHSMQASTLQASDLGPTRSTNPRSRRPPRGQDTQAAAQYPSRRGPEATASLYEYQQTGQDTEYRDETRLRYENEERLRAENEARLHYEKAVRDATNPPQLGARPNLVDPYNVARPPLPQPPPLERQLHSLPQNTFQHQPQQTHLLPPVGETPPPRDETGKKGNRERGDKKRPKPNSPGSSPSSKQKKKKPTRLPYDPARSNQ